MNATSSIPNAKCKYLFVCFACSFCFLFCFLPLSISLVSLDTVFLFTFASTRLNDLKWKRYIAHRQNGNLIKNFHIRCSKIGLTTSSTIPDCFNVLLKLLRWFRLSPSTSNDWVQNCSTVTSRIHWFCNTFFYCLHISTYIVRAMWLDYLFLFLQCSLPNMCNRLPMLVLHFAVQVSDLLIWCRLWDCDAFQRPENKRRKKSELFCCHEP